MAAVSGSRREKATRLDSGDFRPQEGNDLKQSSSGFSCHAAGRVQEGRAKALSVSLTCDAEDVMREYVEIRSHHTGPEFCKAEQKNMSPNPAGLQKQATSA